MRILSLGAVLGLVAVFALGGTVSGQGARQTFTPMPWNPPGGELQPTATGTNAEAAARLALLNQLLLTGWSRRPDASDDPEVLFVRAEQRRQQLSSLAGLNECTLPDQTKHPVNAEVTFNGWSYLCVEVLDSQVTPSRRSDAE
jgi:hypothetical protein